MSAEPILSTASSFRPPAYAAEGRLRLRARQLARNSSARLLRASTRAGGEVGLAAAGALLEMIGSDRSPLGWPVCQLIALLDGEPARRDRQVLGLVNDLRRIQADIGLVALEDSVEAIARGDAPETTGAS